MVSVTRQTGTRSPAVSSLLVTSVVLSALLRCPLAYAEEEAELPASDALPGIYRVGIARTAPAAVAGTLGYGFTEAQHADDGAYHRLSLRAAASVPVVNWLSLGALFDSRYDQHPNDSGGIVDTALQARATKTLGAWQLGAGLVGRLPGAESFSTTMRSASVEGQALVATTVGRVRIASLAGYRFDRSGAAGKDAANLSSGDRLALGLSDFDALLFGLGAGVWVDKNELLAELSTDLLVGSGAPAFSQSPLRVAVGARRTVARGLSLELMAVGSLSQQPDLSPGAPLVPNEPRLSVFASIRYQFLPHLPPPEKPSPPPAPPIQVLSSRLELTVNDDQGAPVTSPTAFAIVAGERRDLSCDPAGHCTLEDAKAGELLVRVEAANFEPSELPVKLQAGVTEKLELRLVAVPPPSQLRGVVRSLDGKAVAVRVRVEPVGTEASVDDQGSFQLDLPPGGYDVVIEADNYVTQRRRVQVEPKGVVVLNVDLARKQ